MEPRFSSTFLVLNAVPLQFHEEEKTGVMLNAVLPYSIFWSEQQLALPAIIISVGNLEGRRKFSHLAT